jgi:hypothetical protein
MTGVTLSRADMPTIPSAGSAGGRRRAHRTRHKNLRRSVDCRRAFLADDVGRFVGAALRLWRR